MITEALIETIDFTANSCTVRIPLFETTNTVTKVVVPAHFCIQPGQVNGYKVGDMVWIAFENNMYQNPIIIGKLFTSLNA